VRDADREEVRAPVARRLGGELHVPSPCGSCRRDEAAAGPVVEPVVHETQLRRVVVHEHGGVATTFGSGSRSHSKRDLSFWS
jgi:hypothetical protein